MSKNTSLYIGIFLLISSFSLIGVSNISRISPNQLSVNQGYLVWNVTGYYKKGEIMVIDIKAHREWGIFLAGERTVTVNISVTGPDNSSVDFVCYFYAYRGSTQSITPSLYLFNASTIVHRENPSGDSLSVEKVQEYIGGIIKKDGNFTVTVDKNSILNSFGSFDPPARIWLLKQEVSYPYAFLLPIGAALIVPGIVSIAHSLHKRKRKRFTGIRATRMH